MKTKTSIAAIFNGKFIQAVRARCIPGNSLNLNVIFFCIKMIKMEECDARKLLESCGDVIRSILSSEFKKLDINSG